MIRFNVLTLLTVNVFLFSACSRRELVLPDTAASTSLSGAITIGDPEPEAVFLQNTPSDPRISNRMWEGVPSIGATTSGNQVYVAWYSGGSGEGPGNYVTVAISIDKAKTWLNDALVVYPGNPSAVRFFDPTIWRDKYDKIWLTWTKSRNFWDGEGGVWTTQLDWNGKNVVNKDTKVLSNGVMLNKPAYVPGKNYMLYPVSWWKFSPSNPSLEGTYIYKAEYEGSAAEPDSLTRLARIGVPDSIQTFDEHQVAEVSDDGKMICMVRTLSGIYYCRSANYGKSWSAPAPFKAVGPTTASRFHLARLQSGNLLLIINNSTERTDLSAFISSDGGKTWPHKLVIDTRSDISYPDAIQTGDGTIHMVYDHDRYGAKDILYCHFTEKDILTANTRAIVRSKVNSQ